MAPRDLSPRAIRSSVKEKGVNCKSRVKGVEMEGVETLDGRKKRLNAIRYRGWRRGREREKEERGEKETSSD